MERKIFAIFVAGGQGVRMGCTTPKQFLLLDGVPVLQRTIEKFLDACPEIQVITVLPKDHFQTWENLCIKHGLNCKQILVEGGITRFHSVKNALEKVPDGAIAMIQDGVRPLISKELIQSMIQRCKKCRALIPVLPCVDTLKSLGKNDDGELVTCDGPDPDRSCVFCAQTPQIFFSEDIKKAYRQPFSMAFTDDASVAKGIKIPLSYIVGERWNIKITTPEDLLIAQNLLSCLSEH